jgi:hypothetical protein
MYNIVDDEEYGFLCSEKYLITKIMTLKNVNVFLKKIMLISVTILFIPSMIKIIISPSYFKTGG